MVASIFVCRYLLAPSSHLFIDLYRHCDSFLSVNYEVLHILILRFHLAGHRAVPGLGNGTPLWDILCVGNMDKP